MSFFDCFTPQRNDALFFSGLLRRFTARNDEAGSQSRTRHPEGEAQSNSKKNMDCHAASRLAMTQWGKKTVVVIAGLPTQNRIDK
jgi:hypothetical protein